MKTTQAVIAQLAQQETCSYAPYNSGLITNLYGEA